jgi:phosphoglycerate dehydrogenase-like enzyme
MTRLLWLTERGSRHQKQALDAAPPQLHVTMLRSTLPAETHLANTDILVSERRGRISAELLNAAPHLKLIVRLGSLFDDIDLAACQQRQILVSCQPVIGAINAAEHVMLQILSLLKHLNEVQAMTLAAHHSLPAARTDENTFSYNWFRFQKVETLRGKTVAIIGMGEIGVELARRLRGFLPTRILYYKRNSYSKIVEQQLDITYADFQTCVEMAEILVCLLPYSKETDKLINADVFQRMKPGSLLVHAGSGSTVDEQALLEALVHLGGAALDTFEHEPLQPEHPLIAAARNPLNNLILTPHLAAGTGSPRRDSDYAEVMRFLAGEPLRHQIV